MAKIQIFEKHFTDLPLTNPTEIGEEEMI